MRFLTKKEKPNSGKLYGKRLKVKKYTDRCQRELDAKAAELAKHPPKTILRKNREL